MDIIVACPTCQRQLRVPDDLLGQLVRCPSCDYVFTSSVEPEPAPEPVLVPDEPARAREPRRHDDDDRPRPARYDEEDDRPQRRAKPRPDKVQAIAVMTLVGGVLALLLSVGLMITCIGFFWPGTYYSLVAGIVLIVKGSELLGTGAQRSAPPQGTAIMQIINVVNLDLINLTMGILTLVFLNEREVREYFRE
jgi:predicted Zn finger-like uncharacterized protein